MSRIDEGGGRRSSYPAYPVHPCSISCSVPRGMTMIELLVALGIFAIAVGSILTIFTAGARHGARAREKMAAGRVALAVFDLVDKGYSSGGRDPTTGDLPNSETRTGGPSTVFGADEFVANSPVLLVWKYEIEPYTADGVAMRQLTVTVAADENSDFLFDSGDRTVRVYEAILANRRVVP